MRLARTIGAMAMAAGLGLAAPAMGQGCFDLEVAPSAGAPEMTWGGTPGMAFDSTRGVTYVALGGAPMQLWAYNGQTWERLPDGPILSQEVDLAYDSARDVVVAWFASRVIEYNPATGTWWLEPEIPPVRPNTRAQIAYDEARGVTVAWGGGPEIWEWDGQAWMLVNNAGPAHRIGGHITYDSARGVMILSGGLNPDTTPTTDLWEWDGQQLVQRSDASPPADRDRSAMVFDPMLDRTVLITGNGMAVWAYDGQSAEWQMLREAEPIARFEYAAAYNAALGRTLVFGGFDGSSLTNEMLRSATGVPGLVQQPRDTRFAPGEPLVLAAAVSGEVLNYRWFKDGVEIEGAASPVLVIESATAEDAGVYVLEVEGPCLAVSSREALVTAACPADFDGNGSLTLSDFVSFRNAFTAGCP